ncbi:MAG: hypothetical protein GF344_12520 [Chitinivibrionales bacterium]|nr:hypothetical protein [Chitinivibrionales bacterium]
MSNMTSILRTHIVLALTFVTIASAQLELSKDTVYENGFLGTGFVDTLCITTAQEDSSIVIDTMWLEYNTTKLPQCEIQLWICWDTVSMLISIFGDPWERGSNYPQYTKERIMVSKEVSPCMTRFGIDYCFGCPTSEIPGYGDEDAWANKGDTIWATVHLVAAEQKYSFVVGGILDVPTDIELKWYKPVPRGRKHQPRRNYGVDGRLLPLNINKKRSGAPLIEVTPEGQHLLYNHKE